MSGSRSLPTLLSLLLLAAATSRAHQYKLEYDKASPQGLLLEEASHTQDDDDRAALLNDFLNLFPKDKSVPWALDQMRQIAERAGLEAKVVEWSRKILQFDPNDLYSAYTIWRLAPTEAEANQAVPLVYTLSKRVVDANTKSPAASSEAKELLSLATAALARIDGEQFDRILRNPDPKTKLASLDDYLRRNPDPEWRRRASPHYFFLYRTLGNHQKAYETAERMLRDDPKDEDALLFVADALFARRTSPDRVLAYSQQVLEILSSKTKPAWYSDSDWNRKKSVYIGSASWISGHLQLERLDFAKAEASFRQALAQFQGDPQTSGYVLFYLGWAEFNLGKLDLAAQVYDQCSKLPGVFQAQAARNVAIVRGQQKAQLNAPDLSAAIPAPLGRGLVALGSGAAPQKFFD